MASGHAVGQSGPGGELFVYPESIVNLNCIYDRKVGNPEWMTASNGKDYPTGEKEKI